MNQYQRAKTTTVGCTVSQQQGRLSGTQRMKSSLGSYTSKACLSMLKAAGMSQPAKVQGMPRIEPDISAWFLVQSFWYTQLIEQSITYASYKHRHFTCWGLFSWVEICRERPAWS